MVFNSLIVMSFTDPWTLIEEQGWRACLNQDGVNYKELMTAPGQWPRNPIFWRPDDVMIVGSQHGEGMMIIFC